MANGLTVEERKADYLRRWGAYRECGICEFLMPGDTEIRCCGRDMELTAARTQLDGTTVRRHELGEIYERTDRSLSVD